MNETLLDKMANAAMNIVAILVAGSLVGFLLFGAVYLITYDNKSNNAPIPKSETKLNVVQGKCTNLWYTAGYITLGTNIYGTIYTNTYSDTIQFEIYPNQIRKIEK